jgi:ParB family chromosome partitioning protein
MKESNQISEKRLGRGLSALIGDSKSKNSDSTIYNLADNEEQMRMIFINKIVAGIYQPRKIFNPQELEELSISIKENGVIQPIILRENDDLYEIIAGERRYRAAKMAGLDRIPAIIKSINNHEALELALIENIQRSDLSLIEEAVGYKQLIADFSYSQEQVAIRVNKSRSHITNILRILNLPESIKELIDKKLISMGHARAIINSQNPKELAKKIVDLSLTVREVEEIVREEKIAKEAGKKVIFNKIKTKNNNLANLTSLREELEKKLHMSIKVTYNNSLSRGKIIIEFEGMQDIKDLIARL